MKEVLNVRHHYLNLVHRVTTKLRPVKLQQAVSESLPNKGTYHLY